MNKAFKAVVKYAGYTVFFVAALVVFVWLTLPLDAVQSYLVRKMADEHNADLSVVELTTWGLSGIEARGVSLVPRPTPEQQEALQQAREARKAWEEAQKKKAEGKGEEASGTAEAGATAEAAPADGKAAPAAEGTPAADPAAVAATVTKPGKAAPPPKGKAKAAASGAAEPEAAKPPPMPTGPRPLYLDALRARVDPLKLLRGDIEGSLEVEALGGTLNAQFQQSREQMALDAAWEGLDLAQLAVLERYIPLPLLGAFGGEIALAAPRDDEGKMRLRELAGHVDLKITRGAVGPGCIESKKLANFGCFEVPRARIEQLAGRMEFDKRRADFKDFAFKGQDLEGELTGYIQLADQVSGWRPRAHLRFKFSDDFLKEHSSVKSALNVGTIRRGQADGFTGFAVTGTLGDQKWQPRKHSPYVSANKGRGAAEADGDADGDDDDSPSATRRPSPVDRKSRAASKPSEDRDRRVDFRDARAVRARDREATKGGTDATGKDVTRPLGPAAATAVKARPQVGRITSIGGPPPVEPEPEHIEEPVEVVDPEPEPVEEPAVEDTVMPLDEPETDAPVDDGMPLDDEGGDPMPEE